MIAEGVVPTDDGVLLAIAEQVFAAYVEFKVAESLRDLCEEQGVGGRVLRLERDAFDVGDAAWQSRASVELQRGIENPASHRGGVLQVEQDFVGRNERGRGLVERVGEVLCEGRGIALRHALQRVSPGGIERHALE